MEFSVFGKGSGGFNHERVSSDEQRGGGGEAAGLERRKETDGVARIGNRESDGGQG